MFASNTSQVSSDAVFVEDIFSTTLYTGNGSTQTITNGIDLSTKGGLVWAKMRSNGSTTGHVLSDTARGPSQKLDTSSTGASSNWTPYGISAFGSTGFTVADDGAGNYVTNNSGVNYVSWTFRKQPKFFDVVTFTGTQNYGGSGQTVSHSLGSTPGCIIIKPLSDTSGSGFTLNNWIVYHRGLSSPTTQHLKLNSTASIDGNSDKIKAVSDTTFTAGWEVGLNGIQYVAYIFAHNAGGFGLTGTDNVISCGSYTGNGSATGPVITLGYEPQWVMVKRATVSTGSWEMYDSMRGFTMEADAVLRADTSGSEFSLQRINPTSTGFQLADSDGDVNANGSTYIYIAIRRGPMKVPTSGTSVFLPSTVGASNNITVGFPADTAWFRYTGSDNWRCFDRLRSGYELATNLTDAEGTYNYYPTYIDWDSNSVWYQNLQNGPVVDYFFRRAPSFFDEVCYTASFPAPDYRAVANHNLTVTPELIIIKGRNIADNWYVYHSALGVNKYIRLNSTAAEVSSSNVFAVSSTTFSTNNVPVASTYNYVAYLFATCAGVSKVGSYTGTGTTLQVDCGFTGGSRFVMIKRTDSTGDWYVWDSARGIVAGNDPYLLLNSTAAEVTSTDYVDTYSAGFEISSTAPAAINASGGTFIFLAIA